MGSHKSEVSSFHQVSRVVATDDDLGIDINI